jgi:hypothetical protein
MTPRISGPKRSPVTVEWLPNEKAILIERGPEVSLIEFSDGRTQYLPNTHFKEETK